MAADPKNQPAEQGFDPAFFQVLFEAEDRHFWFRARNRVIARVVQSVMAEFSPGYRVLEVGCGTGNVLRVLERTCAKGSVMGMDPFEEALVYARQRTGCKLLRGHLRQQGFEGQFDLVCLFDVLEHVPDDIAMLQDIKTALRPGGTLLLTVPAHQKLWSYFDVASCHCRRYQWPGLQAKLAGAGFQTSFISEYMAALYLLAWLKRRLLGPAQSISASEGRKRAMEELRVPRLLNPILTCLLSLESPWIGRRHRLWFGTSILALARKTLTGGKIVATEVTRL